VLAGQLVEYLKLKDGDRGDETWCHRSAHPDGSSPPNAFAYGARRFLPKDSARCAPNFVVTHVHREDEAHLVERLLRSAEPIHVEYFGSSNNPAIVLSVFHRLVQPPYPLLGTTLDAVFAAKARMRVGDLDGHSADQWRQHLRDSASGELAPSETDPFFE
jgi:hypothetical protein